jgi:hypothetical protein
VATVQTSVVEATAEPGSVASLYIESPTPDHISVERKIVKGWSCGRTVGLAAVTNEPLRVKCVNVCMEIYNKHTY